MWVDRKQFETWQQLAIDNMTQKGEAHGWCNRLKEENARLRADLDWFKLRLNQVERERGQLIQAAIGVKIAVPEFVPTYEDPGKALNEMPDLSTVGGDAVDQGEDRGGADPAEGVDYALMPGYRGK